MTDSTRPTALLRCGPALLLLGWASALQAAEGLSGEVVFVLEGALAHDYMKGSKAAPLPLSVAATCDRGTWLDAWGHCAAYNQAAHDGAVVEAEVTAGRIRLKIEMTIRPDASVRGGQATFDVELTRKPARGAVWSAHAALRTSRAAEQLEGTYEGSFRGPGDEYRPTGKAVGIILPAAPPAEGFVPVRPGERPRLLFRATDVPALRAKAKTPLGRAITAELARSEDATALGVMYHLTGDAAYARKTVAAVTEVMSQLGGGEYTKSHEWGSRLRQAAFAYDLCGDTWPPAFRKKVVEYLDRFGAEAMEQPMSFGSAHAVLNPAAGSRFVSALYAGAGLGFLTLWGEKGPPPVEPKPTGLSSVLAKRFGKAEGGAGPSFESRKRQWQADRALWEAHGGADVRYLRMARVGRHRAALNAFLCMGEGGFQAEGEGGTLSWQDIAHDYAVAHQTMFGRPASRRADISHFVPRYVATTVWDGGRCVNQTYGGGGGTVGAAYLCRAIRTCPKDWRAALLWYWLKCLGLSAEEVRTEAGAAKLVQRLRNDPLLLVQTFLGYPLALAPVNPREVMPRVWEAPTRGFYCFRSDWKGPDSIVAQIYAKQGPDIDAVPAPEAGCFQIYGLGHVWAQKGWRAERAWRVMDNVVVLPDESLNDAGGGKVTCFAGDAKTGSGAVTINLDELYTGVRHVSSVGTAPEVRGGVVIHKAVRRTRTIAEDMGIRGRRAFAADYSGAAGAAALFVVVDQIRGGGRKVWCQHLPAGAKRGSGPEVTVDAAARSFTIAQGEASLTATFVAPGEVTIRRARDVLRAGTAKGGETVTTRRDAVLATCQDPDAEGFFVVMTLQRGKAPAVKVAGQGLKAAATVGGRTVSFDPSGAGRIVLGP